MPGPATLVGVGLTGCQRHIIPAPCRLGAACPGLLAASGLFCSWRLCTRLGTQELQAGPGRRVVRKGKGSVSKPGSSRR